MKEIGRGSCAVVGFFISSSENLDPSSTAFVENLRSYNDTPNCIASWPCHIRAVGHRPFTTQSWNEHQTTLCGIYGGHSSTGTEGSPNTAASFC